MSAPRASLSRRLTWSAILAELGTPPTVAYLPAMGRCPRCNKTALTIYADSILGGEWAHCSSCGFAGDLIELAAAVWKCDVRSAVGRLQRRGLVAPAATPEDIDAYMTGHVEYRRRLKTFWENCQRAPVLETTPGNRALLRKFGISTPATTDDWMSGCGRFLGATMRREVEQLFQPGSYEPVERSNRNGKSSVRRGSGGGRGRVFKGAGWNDLLVIPFQDLPRRICGFLFIGRGGDAAAGDIVYKPANFGGNSRQPREAGLAFMDAIEVRRNAIIEGLTFVTFDPIVALHLQMRFLRGFSRPLPLVLAHRDSRCETRSPWINIPRKDWVFFGDDPAILKHAALSGGQVSQYSIGPGEIERGLRHHLPDAWLGFIRQHALGWQQAVYARAEKLSDTAAEELLLSLDLPADVLRNVVEGSHPRLRDRLRRVSPDRFQHRRVRVGRETIVETDAGWHVEKTNERIVNAPIRLDEFDPGNDGLGHFRGSVRHQSRDLSFTAAAKEVHRDGLLPVVRRAMTEQNVLITFDPTWSDRSLSIAEQFQKPRIVRGTTRMGWNSDLGEFLFPRFWIGADGNRGARSLFPILNPQTPGAVLDYPETLTAQDAELLSDHGDDVRLAWAIAACVVTSILGPMYYFPPRGILLEPGVARVGRDIARKLGCAVLDSQRADEKRLSGINGVAGRHDWPLVVAPRPGTTEDDIADAWLDAPGPRNSILSLNIHATRTLATTGHFHVVGCGADVPFSRFEGRTLARIVTGFLEWFCQTGRQLPQEEATPVENVLRHLAAWIKREFGVRPNAVLAARNIFQPAGSVPLLTWLVETAFGLIVERHVDLLSASTLAGLDTATGIVRIEGSDDGPDSVWIPSRLLRRRLRELGAVPVNDHEVTKALVSEGVLRESSDVNPEAGWLIDAAWFGRQVQGLFRQRQSAFPSRRRKRRRRARQTSNAH